MRRNVLGIKANAIITNAQFEVVVAVEITEVAIGLALKAHLNLGGVGFDPQNIPPHRTGLNMMRERAASIGAELSISTQAQHGTEVVLRGPAYDRTHSHSSH